VIDSSVLIVLNRRGNLEEYLKRKRDEGYEVLIPKAIARELLDEPRKYAEEVKKTSPALASMILSSAERMNAALKQGLIKVDTVDYRKYSEIMDNVRKHLSQLEAKPEHAVKKGDPELITLIIQLYDKSREKVFVSTKDKGLLKALRSFEKRAKYEVLEGVQLNRGES